MGFGTNDGAGLAEVLAELGARQSEVEVLRADLNKSAVGRRRGRHGTKSATRQAGIRQGRQAGNKSARQETRQAGGKAVRQSCRHPVCQAWREAGREAGIINSVLKIFNKYIIMR